MKPSGNSRTWDTSALVFSAASQSVALQFSRSLPALHLPSEPLRANSWHNLDLLFDMTAQRYNISLDGALLASNLAFCGDSNVVCNGNAVTIFGGTNFSTSGLPGTIGNDAGFMDNLLSKLARFPNRPQSLLWERGCYSSFDGGGARLRARTLMPPCSETRRAPPLLLDDKVCYRLARKQPAEHRKLPGDLPCV